MKSVSNIIISSRLATEEVIPFSTSVFNYNDECF